MLHMKCDTWHVICDIGHVTIDTWHVTCNTKLFFFLHCLKCQVPSSNSLGVLMIWEENGHRLELSIKHKGVWRTVPATPVRGCSHIMSAKNGGSRPPRLLSIWWKCPFILSKMPSYIPWQNALIQNALF